MIYEKLVPMSFDVNERQCNARVQPAGTQNERIVERIERPVLVQHGQIVQHYHSQEELLRILLGQAE
jgi:hypothetical protein